YTDAEGSDTELEIRAESTGTGGGLWGRRRRVLVNSFPVSIDFDWFERHSRAPHARGQAALTKQRLSAAHKVLLAVDRLDYTKGIDQRLLAFELLLRRGQITA